MVRLVFRPYTQVRRSICTLESRRTSTRVSPGFVLLRHSSPSFGSHHKCSYSNINPEGNTSVDSADCSSYLRVRLIYFHCALGDDCLRALALMIDSLVRVSRRDDKKHFVRVSRAHSGLRQPRKLPPPSCTPKKA